MRRRLRSPGQRLLTLGLATLISVAAMGARADMAAAEPGGTAALWAELDDAVRGYLDAKAALDASKARQTQLETNLAAAEAAFAEGQQKLGAIAASAYRSSGFTENMIAAISNSTPEEFLGRVTLLNGLAAHEHAIVTNLVKAREDATNSKAALEAEIASQTEQLAAMNMRKRQAEKALWANGGGQETGGFNESSEVVADPAPRAPDGTWPAETCSVYEPTTGGCTTPRTAHARDQAIAAGFTNYVSCFRSVNDGGEHPKGQACDFAMSPGGFTGTAVDSARTYGNSLAAFLIYNANRLGVLYVIWFRQIWLPSSGWRAYSGCCDPSSMHTDHVHVSMY